MAINVFAPAKVNLSLHITGQRADGYHLLDSLVAFAPVGDRLVLSAGQGLTMSVDGPEGAGVPVDDSNLAVNKRGVQEYKEWISSFNITYETTNDEIHDLDLNWLIPFLLFPSP